MYKVGVLGNCCTHGVGAVNSLNVRGDIKIIAGYESNPRRASELSNALGFELAESYEEICENSDVDIVVMGVEVLMAAYQSIVDDRRIVSLPSKEQQNPS